MVDPSDGLPEGPGRDAEALTRLFAALRDRYGPQDWWPGESPFEIAVGAILVQRTTWENAASAIEGLKAGRRLTAANVLDLSSEALGDRIRPAGFYRAKSRCLRGFCRWLTDAGGFAGLRPRPTSELREGLLSLTGIGPETADCILLYALDRPVFVIDAYTRRILVRTGLRPSADRVGYERLRAWFEDRLPNDPALFNELHALFVAHGKFACRTRPRCQACAIVDACNYGRRRGEE